MSGTLRAGAFFAAGLLGLAASLPQDAAAGAWTRKDGSHYVSVAADFFLTSAFEDPNTIGAVNGRFIGRQFSVYGEVGPIKNVPLQFSVHVPVVSSTLHFLVTSLLPDDLGRASSFRMGDLRVGVQGGILNGPFNLAVGANFKIPLYSNDQLGVDRGVWQRYFPRPGDGQLDIDLAAFFGGAIPGTPLWIEGMAGYRFRTEAFFGWDTESVFVDSVIGQFKLGASLGPVVLIFEATGNKNVVESTVTREGLDLGGTVAVTLAKLPRGGEQRGDLSLFVRAAGPAVINNASRGLSIGGGLAWNY